MHAIEVVLAAQLQLDHRGIAKPGGPGRRVVGGENPDRHVGGDCARLFEAGQVPDRPPRELGLEIPQRAVQRISRRAGRQGPLQAGAVQFVPLETGNDAFDLLPRRLRRLIVDPHGAAFAVAATAPSCSARTWITSMEAMVPNATRKVSFSGSCLVATDSFTNTPPPALQKMQVSDGDIALQAKSVARLPAVSRTASRPIDRP